MLSPFAALESRLNSAVERHISNVEVVHAGGDPFGAVLNRTPSEPFGSRVVDSATLDLGFIASRAPGLAEGDQLLIGGVPYIVNTGVQPDETGWLQVGVYAKG